MKFKVEFNKYISTGGQTIFERSLTLESLNVLLVTCDEIQVHRTGRKKTGTILFIFSETILNRYARAKNVKLYILKKFLPEEQWIDPMKKGVKRK